MPPGDQDRVACRDCMYNFLMFDVGFTEVAGLRTRSRCTLRRARGGDFLALTLHDIPTASMSPYFKIRQVMRGILLWFKSTRDLKIISDFCYLKS